jgi:predicted dehydrogenase
MSSRSKVRFALVGAGAIADIHARAITCLPEVAELHVVVSTRDATARRMAEAHGARG